MMVHVANAYIVWINNFVLKGNRIFFSDDEILDVDQPRAIFNEVDHIMNQFCLLLSQIVVQPVKVIHSPVLARMS